jgi:uncharacterized protein YqgC (DUF456 family)
VNLLCWVGILFGLPGTWLIVLFPVLLKWWQPDQFMVSWTVLEVAVALAVLGEVIEFVLGAAGSRRTGGSTRGAVLALVGSIVGGIMGIALPVPLVGPLLGACLGAFVGALLGNLWTGRTLFQSFAAGRGAVRIRRGNVGVGCRPNHYRDNRPIGQERMSQGCRRCRRM